MIEFTEALAAIATKSEALWRVAKASLTFDQREMLMDLRERIIELRGGALDLVEENRRLAAELENERELKATEKRGNVLYDTEGNGPFCIICAAKGRVLIPLVQESVSSRLLTCFACRNTFSP